MKVTRPQYFFVAISPDGKAQIFGTKFLPMTGKRPARFKFWRMNVFLEEIEKPVTVSWESEHDNQRDQLQAALPAFRVLSQYEFLNAVERGIQLPAK